MSTQISNNNIQHTNSTLFFNANKHHFLQLRIIDKCKTDYAETGKVALMMKRRKKVAFLYGMV